MKQAIVNFCKSMDTGLFLLDMPTGFGKTYSVLDFMVDNYDAPEFKDKKIFFVTTLKKNLPDKELREHFAKRGKADDYDKYCLRIEANADMVIEKLDELYRARKIPVAITMKQEFKDLHGSVKLLNEYRDKKRELKGTSKDIINVLCKNAEDAIRKHWRSPQSSTNISCRDWKLLHAIRSRKSDRIRSYKILCKTEKIKKHLPIIISPEKELSTFHNSAAFIYSGVLSGPFTGLVDKYSEKPEKLIVF